MLSNGGSDIIKYEIQQDDTDAFPCYSLKRDVASLTNGTTYIFKVRAVNAAGASDLKHNEKSRWMKRYSFSFAFYDNNDEKEKVEEDEEKIEGKETEEGKANVEGKTSMLDMHSMHFSQTMSGSINVLYR